MSWHAKWGLALVVAGTLLFIREMDLAGPDPANMATLAVRQLDGGASAAQELRLAETTRNWQMVVVPLLILLAGAALLWDDLAKLWRSHDESKSEGGGQGS